MQTNDWKEKLGMLAAGDPNMRDELARIHAEESKLPKETRRQHFRIELDKSGRNGKQATLITGFDGYEDELKELAADLKRACGVGGSCRGGEILVQGDLRKKVGDMLVAKGHKVRILQ